VQKRSKYGKDEIILQRGSEERERKREREREKRREEKRKPQGGELSRTISFAERSSFGSANARLPRRNRKLRLGFHLRCCAAERVGAKRLGGIRRRENASRCPAT